MIFNLPFVAAVSLIISHAGRSNATAPSNDNAAHWYNVQQWHGGSPSDSSSPSSSSAETKDSSGNMLGGDLRGSSATSFSSLDNSVSALINNSTSTEHRKSLAEIDAFLKSSSFQHNTTLKPIFVPIAKVFKTMNGLLSDFAKKVTDASQTLNKLDGMRDETLESFYKSIEEVAELHNSTELKEGESELHGDVMLERIILSIREKFDANIAIIRNYVQFCLERKSRLDGALLMYEAIKLDLGKLAMQVVHSGSVANQHDITMESTYTHLAKLKDSLEKDKLNLISEVEGKKKSIYEGMADIVVKWRNGKTKDYIMATQEGDKMKDMTKNILHLNEEIVAYEFMVSGATVFLQHCKRSLLGVVLGVSGFIARNKDKAIRDTIEDAKSRVMHDSTPDNDHRIEKVEKEDEAEQLTIPEDGTAVEGRCPPGLVPMYDSTVSSIPAPCVRKDVPKAAVIDH